MRMVQAWDNAGTALDGWGSHVIVLWDEVEPSKGVYNWDLVDKALLAKNRPCYLQVAFSLYYKTSSIPIDHTAAPHRNSLRLTAAPGRVGTIPRYDAAWRAAYGNMVEALATRYRNHPRVAGYWHAVGWNQETQAAANAGGVDWGKLAVSAGLQQGDYLAAIGETTARAVAVWKPQPVYLPGAPSPGGVWGTKRRDVIAAALEGGAAYMNCGLQPDHPQAFGLGGHAGLGMVEITTHAWGPPGFEEGPILGGMPYELYWNLMHARHWQAAFVCLYSSLSGKHYPEISGLLPSDNARWIVFRDAEYAPVTYQDAQGRTFGHSGEPGCWGKGIVFTSDADHSLHCTPERFGFDRWVLHASTPLQLRLPDMSDGLCPCVVWHSDGSRHDSPVMVKDGIATLPTGEYHRVDILPVPTPDPIAVLNERLSAQALALEELGGRVARIEKAAEQVAAVWNEMA